MHRRLVGSSAVVASSSSSSLIIIITCLMPGTPDASHDGLTVPINVNSYAAADQSCVCAERHIGWSYAGLQRAFFCFGMDVLLKLNLAETRSFFNAFFDLSDFHWHGFLSARLGFLQLIGEEL
jgi:lycopene beta-cyclase